METSENKPNNLDTYSTLFLIKGIFTSLFAFVPLLYIVFGSFLGAAIEADAQQEMPFDPGVFIVVAGIIGFLIMAAMAVVSFIASSNLKKRKGYQFIFVVAILNCLSGFLGILLGIFTLFELNKPHVKALFEKK